MSQYLIYTDGSCTNNGKPNSFGGWSYVIVHNIRALELWEEWDSGCGGTKDTTISRMELMGPIEGLRRLNAVIDPNFDDITVISDSKYVVDAFRQDWIRNWKINGWKNAKGKTVVNLDLWQQLISLAYGKPHITWEHVHGHTGDKWNEYCDKLAGAASKEYVY